jgi:hypothetical protein
MYVWQALIAVFHNNETYSKVFASRFGISKSYLIKRTIVIADQPPWSLISPSFIFTFHKLKFNLDTLNSSLEIESNMTWIIKKTYMDNNIYHVSSNVGDVGSIDPEGEYYVAGRMY